MKHFFMAVVALVATLAGCSGSGSEASAPGQDTTVASLGNGSIRTFIRLDKSGAPASIGAVFNQDMLTGLSSSGAEYTLAFPPQASGTLFTHLYFDWRPLGHAPGMVYDRPHFDFHFYLVPVQQRLAVAQGLDTFPIPTEYLPSDFIKVTESVAFMGTHYADSTAGEFHGLGFDQTALYGYHEGQLTFYDVMLAKQWLDTKPNVTFAIKQPSAFQRPGYYPTQYSVSYSARRREYRVALEGFAKH